MPKILHVKNLHKQYGGLIAVKDVSFEVEEGEIFGIVGPNGAGKTTTIECIEGLREADGGEISLLGKQPIKDKQVLFEQIGIQLQESSLPPRLKVKEALDLFATFYEKSESPDRLCSLLGLEEKQNAPFAKLSGGQKQRLFIALALINKPRVIFFDELTTGLDPQARHSMWELVKHIRDEGCTVFLTTHFMEETEKLCDRVLILDQGSIVALDSPASLVDKIGAEKRISFALPLDLPTPAFNDIPQVNRVERMEERVMIFGRGERFISKVVARLEDEKIPFHDLSIEQPNLEDVFLALTGREIRE
jgi:ABC-2 type transport system ATP-binding protein